MSVDIELEVARRRLQASCSSRDLSPEAHAELARLLTDGSREQIEDVLAHLDAIPVIHAADIDVCAETTARLDQLMAQRQAKADQHRRRLAAAAFRLGEQSARHEISDADAEARLDRLAALVDPDWPSCGPVLSASEARRIGVDAFFRGTRAAKTRPARRGAP